MNSSVFLTGLFAVILISSACLAAVLIYLNPYGNLVISLSLFYSSLFISSTGLITLVGFLIRKISRRKKFSLPLSQLVRQFEISFRQGLLLSVILISVLMLQSQRILSWWHLTILVGLIGLAEWWLNKRDY